MEVEKAITQLFNSKISANQEIAFIQAIANRKIQLIKELLKQKLSTDIVINSLWSFKERGKKLPISYKLGTTFNIHFSTCPASFSNMYFGIPRRKIYFVRDKQGKKIPILNQQDFNHYHCFDWIFTQIIQHYKNLFLNR